MTHRLGWALPVCFLLAAAGAQSAEVYRWTDAQGRVFYGDRAPEGRKSSARVIEIDQAPPVRAQIATRPAAPSRRAAPTTPEASMQTEPAVIGGSQSLPRLADKDARCEAAWARFDESAACFAPYRMGGGKVRPEAYLQCETVMMPSDC